MNRIIHPYRGDQPYIFLSYAHKNMDEAMTLIERLQADGYRVWYDEGIDPGTEWDENIATHLEKCGYVIALLSKEYLDSSNCRDELNYARDLEKPRLLVYLSNVELPGGMRMRLSRLQAIHKYRYDDLEYFYEKLYEAKNLNTCLDKSRFQRKEKTAETTSVKRPKKRNLGSGKVQQRQKESSTKTNFTASPTSKPVDSNSALLLKGLGGKENLAGQISFCATRLRLTVYDPSKVDKKLIDETGAFGTTIKGNQVAVIYGVKVATIANAFFEFLSSPESDHVDELLSPMNTASFRSGTVSQDFKEPVSSLLPIRNIRLNQKSAPKEDLIRAAGQMLVDSGCVEPSYIDGMILREDLFATNIGNGIAIPHGVEEARAAVKKSGISVQTFPETTEWGDSGPVKVVIGIAGAGDDHLDILMRIATKLSSKSEVDRLMTMSPEEIQTFFTTD